MVNGEEKLVEEKDSTIIEDNTKDYIEEIQKLRDSSIPKEEYNRLKEENKRLITTLASGGNLKSDAPQAKEDIVALRAKLFNSENLSNLDYCSTALELRDALMAEGKPDPFLPVGHEIVPSNTDRESAERVASVLKECVEYAQGDADIFTDELQRRLVDSTPRRKR